MITHTMPLAYERFNKKPKNRVNVVRETEPADS